MENIGRCGPHSTLVGGFDCLCDPNYSTVMSLQQGQFGCFNPNEVGMVLCDFSKGPVKTLTGFQKRQNHVYWYTVISKMTRRAK